MATGEVKRNQRPWAVGGFIYFSCKKLQKIEENLRFFKNL